MKPVAVLGCGPAGMLADYACQLSEKPVAIFSKPEKSRLGGAQYLHMPIPGLTEQDPEAMLVHRVYGDADTYQRKVYGDDPTVPFVSFSNVRDGSEQPAWNLPMVYDRLWDEFKGVVNEAKIGPQWVADHEDEFEVIFSTVPLVHLCYARAGWINQVHRFTVQDILVHPGEYQQMFDNTVVYDGTEERSWYRASNIFGHQYTEWSTLGPEPMVETVRDRKPISTSCDCWRNVVRLGRRGTWTKGILTHDAFLGVLKVLS
jgi:hypothetical protein